MKEPLEIPKLFTVEEANQLLSVLEPLLKELLTVRRKIEDKQVQIDALELISDGHSPKVDSELKLQTQEFNGFVEQFNLIAKQIEEKGCLIKDVEQGLIDFFGMHEGEVVFYCWRLGESKVAHWHEVGSGFASRKPLDLEKE